MSHEKHLYAIHRQGATTLRTKIATGQTADFAKAIGFQIENVVPRGPGEGGFDPLEGLDGTYPVLEVESFSRLEGKLLTLCDATFTNKDQRESFKSIIKDNLWSMFAEEVTNTQVHFHKAEREIKE